MEVLNYTTRGFVKELNLVVNAIPVIRHIRQDDSIPTQLRTLRYYLLQSGQSPTPRSPFALCLRHGLDNLSVMDQAPSQSVIFFFVVHPGAVVFVSLVQRIQCLIQNLIHRPLDGLVLPHLEAGESLTQTPCIIFFQAHIRYSFFTRSNHIKEPRLNVSFFTTTPLNVFS